MISLATFAHPAEMMRRFMEQNRIPGIVVPAVLRYLEWVIGRPYDEFAPVNTACRVRCPVLMIHGSSDRTVPVADLEAIRRRCEGTAVEFLLVPRAGHKLVGAVEKYGDVILAFLARAGLSS